MNSVIKSRIYNMGRNVERMLTKRFIRNIYKDGFRVSSEVFQAVQEKRPVVALESAIITHGMPFPHNLRTATSLELIIRNNGAIPATVGVIDGEIIVGLERSQLEHLASSKNTSKMSTRDYPFAVKKLLTGGTTVAATIYAAKRCGIEMMATGGIGGVHLDVEKDMDISADLLEMSRTRMAVVSSGIKSILDLNRTLEYMETLGIGLASYNNAKHLPGFFSEKSGRMAPYDMNSAEEAADILLEWMTLGLPGGLLMAVPVPTEHSISSQLVENILKEAHDEAKSCGVVGKDVTPFILQQIVSKTHGKSLQTNVALVENNAMIAAQIAVEYSRLLKSKQNKSPISSRIQIPVNTNNNSPVVVGGSNVDYIVKMDNDVVQAGGATNLGRIAPTFGGVGRNLAEGLTRLGLRPLFISAVGQDQLGKQLMASIPCTVNIQLMKPVYSGNLPLVDMLEEEEEVDIQRGIAQRPDARTATYCVVLRKSGDVYLGVGDMSIHQTISPQQVETFVDDLRKAPMVVIDGNTPTETIDYILDICAQNQNAVWFEPTDINRAEKPFHTDRWRTMSYLSPNVEELRHMYSAVTKDRSVLGESSKLKVELEPLCEEVIQLSRPLLEYVPCVMVTMSHHGLLVLRNTPFRKTPFPARYVRGGGHFSAVHYAAPSVPVVNVSGSGDSLAAAMMAGILTGRQPEECVQAGLQAAAMSLQSQLTIPQELRYASIYANNTTKCPSRIIFEA